VLDILLYRTGMYVYACMYICMCLCVCVDEWMDICVHVMALANRKIPISVFASCVTYALCCRMYVCTYVCNVCIAYVCMYVMFAMYVCMYRSFPSSRVH